MAAFKVEICGVNTAKLPLLTAEEKVTLLKRIKEGDTKAREKYIKGNLRLVLSVVKVSEGYLKPDTGQPLPQGHGV